MTTVTIHILEIDDPLPTPDLYRASIDASSAYIAPRKSATPPAEEASVDSGIGKKRSTPTHFSGGARKSKRIRQTKDKSVKKQLGITKTDSVRDVKVKVCLIFFTHFST